MATKKLIIETTVNTDQVDKAVQKLGQLKDLGRGLQIQYDIDGKPIQLVIDKSLNLQKQLRLVTAELRKTKEGTAEFALLSKTQGDLQDGLARTTAKSKDLFSSLSLLPGPVGQFFGQLQGAIELLKTFTSFSTKDLRFQLGETVNDLVDISDNVVGAKESLDTLSEINNNTAKSTEGLANATEKVSEANVENATTAGQNAQAQGTLAAAVLKNNEQINKYISLQKVGNNFNIAAKKNIEELTEAELQEFRAASTSFAQKVKNKEINLAAVKASEAFKNAKEGEVFVLNLTTGALETQTVATIALTQAERVATFVTNAFKVALVGLGIGAVIILVQAIIESLSEYFTKTKDAEKATEAFNEQLKVQAQLLKESQAQLDFETKKAVLLAEIAGKSEKEIGDIKKKGLEGRKKLLTQELNDALQLQKNLAAQDVTKLTEAQAKARLDAIDANRQKIVTLREEESRAVEAIELNDLEVQKTAADKKREQAKTASDKRISLNKTEQDKIANDNKKANDLLLKLQQENSVAILDTERKRQDEQLKVDKANEERDINNLKISEELKGKLLEQIRVKYGVKVIELNKKRQEEDNKSFDESQKKLKEYQDRIFEIFNKAETDELARNKAARAKKFEDDKTAIQNDTNFQKQSLEEKIRILLALEKAFNQDI
jgi:hypothetical protein